MPLAVLLQLCIAIPEHHSKGPYGNRWDDLESCHSDQNWWTGEDSNLRSSQGAADLQSAAINHSATCPLNANHWMSMPPRSSRPYSSSRLSRGAAESLHAGKAKNPFRYAASQPPLAGPRACLKTKSVLERETGIEPATNSLEGCDSTTELLPQTSKNFWSRRPGLNR